MFKPVLVAPDATNDEASRHITASLVEISNAAENIFLRAEAKLANCQSRAEKIFNRIKLIEAKVAAIENTENAVLTYPTRYPVNNLNPLAVLFEKDNLSGYIQKDDDKAVFKENAVNSQMIKDAITRKKDYGYAFGRGKHLESLKNLKRVDADDGDSCGLLDEDFIYAEKEKRKSAAGKFTFQSESLLIYESAGRGFGADPFAYKPQLGALSDFDFPDILPKLPGIKKGEDNEQWSFPSIAPSALGSNEVGTSRGQVDLTTPGSIYQHKTAKSSSKAVEHVETPRAPEMDVPENLVIQKPNVAVPPPSPPPLINTAPALAPVQPVSEEPVMATGVPPPPPPPPPNMLNLPALPVLPDISRGRSDLMDAIRKAGGAGKAKLKTVDIVTPEKEKSSATPKVTEDTGDDLMSSLSKALEQRRKGISGSASKKLGKLEKPKQSTSTGEPFSRLRNSIPVLKQRVGVDGSDDEGNWD